MARGLTNVNGHLYACAESRAPGFAWYTPGATYSVRRHGMLHRGFRI